MCRRKSQAILLHRAEVEFEDEEEDVEEVEVDQTPKRSVHGRQATAFVPKSKVRASPQVQRAGKFHLFLPWWKFQTLEAREFHGISGH